MDAICFENEDGTKKYKVTFNFSDYIWIDSVEIADWGQSTFSFCRKIEGQKIIWRESDFVDKMLQLTPWLIHHLEKLVKLRVFL
jgi:hypothetical protein